MIDTAKIIVEGGRGGNGIVSFRREKYIPKGGPDGGDGGEGGGVILQASREINTLSDQNRKHYYNAQSGTHGGGNNRHGKNGTDLIIPLPIGTIIYDDKKHVIADLSSDGQKISIASGGRGGLGNPHFATPTNRVPRECTPGKLGEKKKLFLELKLIADVGIIGLPNSGKSTLLATLTHAKPNIANYPFSSLEPILGVANYKKTSYTYVDIPGLVAGAASGKGLGDQFLRHIERTKILLHLIRADSKNPLADYRTIRNELKQFNAMLVGKQEIIAITFSDLATPVKIKKSFSSKLFQNAIVISAPNRENIDKLQDAVIASLSESLRKTLL